MDNEKFAAGMRVSKPSEKAPKFIIANIGINVADFLFWANKHSDRGWVNIQVKESKSGKLYAELDDYKRTTPNPKDEVKEEYPDDTCKDCTPSKQCASCSIPF